MNRYLIDTHVLVWLMMSSHLVGDKTKQLLSSDDAVVYVSTVSFWELTLKHKKGKFPHSFAHMQKGTEALGVQVLDMSLQHIARYTEQTYRHDDPFDVLLLTQAHADSFDFVTADKAVLACEPAALDARL